MRHQRSTPDVTFMPVTIIRIRAPAPADLIVIAVHATPMQHVRRHVHCCRHHSKCCCRTSVPYVVALHAVLEQHTRRQRLLLPPFLAYEQRHPRALSVLQSMQCRSSTQTSTLRLQPFFQYRQQNQRALSSPQSRRRRSSTPTSTLAVATILRIRAAAPACIIVDAIRATPKQHARTQNLLATSLRYGQHHQRAYRCCDPCDAEVARPRSWFTITTSLRIRTAVASCLVVVASVRRRSSTPDVNVYYCQHGQMQAAAPAGLSFVTIHVTTKRYARCQRLLLPALSNAGSNTSGP
jgi:hypothetical protein